MGETSPVNVGAAAGEGLPLGGGCCAAAATPRATANSTVGVNRVTRVILPPRRACFPHPAFFILPSTFSFYGITTVISFESVLVPQLFCPRTRT